jgi:hypothetical protein
MSTLWLPRENKYYEEVTIKIEALRNQNKALRINRNHLERLVRWRGYQLDLLKRTNNTLTGGKVKIVSINEYLSNKILRMKIESEVLKFAPEIKKLNQSIDQIDKEIEKLYQYRETLKTVVLRFEDVKVRKN